MRTYGYDRCAGRYVQVLPLPYCHTPLRWLWLRMTGYRDEYGRKARLLLPWG